MREGEVPAEALGRWEESLLLPSRPLLWAHSHLFVPSRLPAKPRGREGEGIAPESVSRSNPLIEEALAL